MSELQRFLPEDQDILVGLMCRIGMWISSIDDTDINAASEDKEEVKLREVLQSLSTTKKSVLVAELASEALRQKSNWPRWSTSADTVLDDVVAAKDILKSQGTHLEMVAFSKALMLIGTVVAKAFREDNDLKEDKGYLAWLTEKANELTLAVTDHEAYKDMNISPAESTALTELFMILKDK
ncbi:MAG: hypothetical protein AAB276_05210 [Pseudomonadota bacterium]